MFELLNTVMPFFVVGNVVVYFGAVAFVLLYAAVCGVRLLLA